MISFKVSSFDIISCHCVFPVNGTYQLPVSAAKRVGRMRGLGAPTAPKDATDTSLPSQYFMLCGWRATLRHHAAHKECEGDEADQTHDEYHEDIDQDERRSGKEGL